MRKVILYIATSLDGKIAKPDGDTSWLHNLPNPEKTDYGYSEFYKSIDTTLMGRKTYEVIAGFDLEHPLYLDKTNYVFSSKSIKVEDHYQVINSDPAAFVKQLKNQNGIDIWLVGGGELNALLFKAGLIDEFMVFVMPIVLGSGIPLFGNSGDLMKELYVVSTKVYQSGAILMRYKAGS